MEKKLIAFDMYKTCLDITWERELLLLSRILGITKENIYDTFLTKDISFIEAFKDNKEVLEQQYKPKLDAVLDSIHPYPETLYTLNALKQSWYQIAVISNVAADFIPPIKKHLSHIFDYELFSCKEGIKKPQKEIFKLLMQRSWYKANEILMVGNNMSSDVIGAKWAGIDSFLIQRDGKGIEQFDTYTKISSLDQIFELL